MKYHTLPPLFLILGLTLTSPAWSISGSYLSNGTPVDTRVYPGSGGPSGVVKLLGNQYTCSGVAISPTVILTAAHCWQSNSTAMFSNIETVNGQQFRTTDERLITSFVTYPSYNRGSNAVQTNDIGLAFLSSALPSFIQTYALGTFSNQRIPGSLVKVAGFGVAMGGNDSTYTSSVVPGEYFYSSVLGGNVGVPQLRAGLNIIDSFISGGTVFMTDFDAPGQTPLGASEAGTTQGDSGSGVFMNSDLSSALYCQLNPGSTGLGCNGSIISQKLTVPAKDIVFGITSYSYSRGCAQGDIACYNRFGTSDGYTAVGPYLDWIDSLVDDVIASSLISSLSSIEFGGTTELSSFAEAGFVSIPPAPLDLATVPEPSGLALVALGCLALLVGQRQKRRPRV